ncbi:MULTISPECIES: ThiF family adenylyltransferase [Bacillus]|uniref:ThiF family adenylyltransferase n=1 Tax=Bacillus TaxID=1386 RepID=UPI0001CE34B5|nr:MULTISPECIES: ThiF family adenylyltransferase [Bacillus]AMK74588.1 hypothetical protein AWV81_21870 [Bacillus subtilis subsp. natto]API44308.1 hypothetical protein BSR08_18300 [Bacillus subtilis]API96591.1 hypothetical protein BKP58_12455 [Bacillus subtilis]ARI86710.1 hypothetical protein B7470_11505 [Bacillus subtilis]ASB72259.1 Sulfur carrier protein ThiS adenylyltransferase [Bacillus subtilis subsp. subtilis]
MEHRYSLNTSIRCDLLNDGLVVMVADNEPVLITEGIDEYLEFLSIFRFPVSKEIGLEQLNNAFYVNNSNYNKIFEFSIENNIIKTYDDNVDSIKTLSDYQLQKFDRQIKSFNTLKGLNYSDAHGMQCKLVNSKIIIIGVGGIGSYLSLSLASMGVEDMVIIDKDEIELSNTSRQILYSEDDIGKSKVQVAARKLKKYNKNLKLHTYEKFITTIDDLQIIRDHHDADLIVLCADTPRGEIQYMVDQISQDLKIPWMFFGPYNHSKVVIGPLIIPGKTKSYSDIFPKLMVKNDCRTEIINENFIASIIDPFNGIAAKMASIEILKYITGYHMNSIEQKRILLDTDDWIIEKRLLD